MQKRFEPIAGQCGTIVEHIMAVPEMPDDPGIQFKVRLCSEEAVANVVDYAYGDGDGFLEVTTDVADGSFIITLKDAGMPFDPLKNPDPDITLSADERKIGGLGIFLCKQMMDEVHYAYCGGCNVLTMKIKINIQL